MKFFLLKISMIVLCFIAPVTNASQAEQDSAVAVGFEVINKWDDRRPYRVSLNGKNGVRPIQVAIWYPAKPDTGKKIQVSYYYTLQATSDSLQPISSGLSQAVLKEILSDPYVENDNALSSLNRWSRARVDAEPLEGQFPIILYAPGSSSGWHDNHAMAEALASKGYVVISSNSSGSRHHNISWDRIGVEAEVSDLAVLYEIASGLDYTSKTDIAVIGRSWGGVAAVEYSHRNFEVDALIGLDATYNYNMDQLLESFPEFPHSDKLKTPTLSTVGLQRSKNATPIDRNHFYEDVTNTFASLLEYKHLPHSGFSSVFMDKYYNAGFSDDQQTQRSDLGLSYDLLIEDISIYLAGIFSANESKSTMWRESDLRSFTSKSTPSLPGFDDFSRMALDEGPAAAMNFYETILSINSAHAEDELFNKNSLRNILHKYLLQGEYERIDNFMPFVKQHYPFFAPHYRLHARSKWAAGEIQEAKKILKLILAKKPNDGETKNLLEKLF